MTHIKSNSSESIPEKQKSLFQGTGVAMATPFDEKGAIDYPSLERLLAKLLEAKVDNLVLFGTTGESPTISTSEKREVIDFVKKRIKGSSTNLIVGIASNDTTKLMEMVAKAPLEDVAGILSSTPFYNKPSQEGLYQHFAALAQASPVPIVVYNIPSRTGCDLLPDTLLRLRKDFPTKIVAVKESTGKVERVAELCKKLDPDFTVLSGDDCHTLDFIKVGAKGAVSVVANAFPKLVKEIIDDALSSQSNMLSQSEALDKDCTDLYHVLFEDGNPSGIKCLLHKINIFSHNRLRLPLVPVCEATEKHIIEALHNMHLKGYC